MASTSCCRCHCSCPVGRSCWTLPCVTPSMCPWISWSGRRPSPATELALPTCPTPAPAAPRVWRSTTAPRLLQKTQTLTLNARSWCPARLHPHSRPEALGWRASPCCWAASHRCRPKPRHHPSTLCTTADGGLSLKSWRRPCRVHLGSCKGPCKTPRGWCGRLQLLWPGWNTVRPVISLSGSWLPQGQHVARWTDRPRGPRPGVGQSCGQSALHHPQTLGREPAAQHALLQPQQCVRPVRVGMKLQTMRNEGFTRLELF